MTTGKVETTLDKDTATPRIIGMRDSFFNRLFEIFKGDKDCIIITADNGAPTLDQFALELPDQFLQVGIAEQTMIGMAAGLAVEGKKVFCYAIAPFVTTRTHEFVKLDLCAMNLPITLIGVGAGYAYSIMGPSHHTVEDISIMRVLPNLCIYSPADSVTAAGLVMSIYAHKGPVYIRLDRAGIPDLYHGKESFSTGLACPRLGQDLMIVATGIMVHQALKVADLLKDNGIEVTVVDVYCLKPFNYQLLSIWIGPERRIVSLEEHLLPGGLGSILAELMADELLSVKRLLRIGQSEKFVFEYGGREAIWEDAGLDVSTVTKRIQEWL